MLKEPAKPSYPPSRAFQAKVASLGPSLLERPPTQSTTCISAHVVPPEGQMKASRKLADLPATFSTVQGAQTWKPNGLAQCGVGYPLDTPKREGPGLQHRWVAKAEFCGHLSS